MMTAVSTLGTLVLAATPLGRAEDASPRLTDELRSADLIAAEDTRRLRRLLRDLDVETDAQIVSYFDGNERRRVPVLLEALRAGKRVIVVTDAGMPSVSDPGFRLVAAAADAGIRVTAVPGPSAALTALVVSGLPTDRFTFEGFLPRKAGERTRRLHDLAQERRTMVFFEAPHRTQATLIAMREAFGADRTAAVCRELTKTHEEVRRGSFDELVEWADAGVRGEVTIVVAGAPAESAGSEPTELVAAVAERMAAGLRRKEAIAEVARAAGVPRREVYNLVHGADGRNSFGGARAPL
jgi:16S rRNA (cytidine1402-2'-O)-methyltransferase